MYPGGFARIMLDVLEPRLMYKCLGEPFYNVNENDEGKMEITVGKLVPDYHSAIQYYLQYCLDEKTGSAFHKAFPHDKVTAAYSSLWSKFRSEISSTATQSELQSLLILFKDLAVNLKRYEEISKWIFDEREQIMIVPKDSEGRKAQIEFMNDVGNILSLLSCLSQARTIISQGLELLTSLSSKPTIRTVEAPKPNPPATDKPEKITIYILPDARQSLIDDLIKYVDPAQHESLKSLINKELELEQPIICRCEQVRLGKIFYERVRGQKENWKIQPQKTKLRKWICRYFRRTEGDTVKEVTPSLMDKHLKGAGFAQYQ